jgi:hypothetical protein
MLPNDRHDKRLNFIHIFKNVTKRMSYIKRL